jgi:E3 ubiquitin-protein ligase HERC2
MSWGRGNHGCLGHGDTISKTSPTKIKNLSNISDLACGWSHSLCIDANGKLFTFGKGAEGQLGHGKTDDVLLPKIVEFFQTPPLIVVAVAAGYGHSAILAGPRREMYTFGWGEHGQLGHGNIESLTEPLVVKALFTERLDLISCGGFHTLALTEEGTCWSWGDGSSGQLGREVGKKKRREKKFFLIIFV